MSDEIINIVYTDPELPETGQRIMEERKANSRNPMVLPLDLALIRWSVVCAKWGELSSGHAPLLAAFLAGWCCRCIGASMPENVGTFRDSFRVGWREADDHIQINRGQNEKGRQ